MSSHHNRVLQISGGMDQLRETLAFLGIEKRIQAWCAEPDGTLHLSAEREQDGWLPFPAKLSTDALCGVVQDYLRSRIDGYMPGESGFLLRVVPKCFRLEACEICGAPDPNFFQGFRMTVKPYSTKQPQVFKISGEFSSEEICRNLAFMQEFFHIRFNGESYPLNGNGYLLGIGSKQAYDEDFSRVPGIALLIDSKIPKQVVIPNVVWDEGSPGYLLERIPSKEGFGALVVRPYVCFWHK